MGWCLPRAVNSCRAQSIAVDEIIVVDDCSTDNTEAVVTQLRAHDARIRYFKLAKNGQTGRSVFPHPAFTKTLSSSPTEETCGHLAALKFGAQKAVSDWVALLDADDELTHDSIKDRLLAAGAYEEATGVKPQLVYGDLEELKFTRLKGYSFPYLCKELSLCQTSTIMLGKKCIPNLPVEDTYNTDDEIVLSIGKKHHILHSGVTVAICHSHDSLTRMSNNARKVFEGVCDLVRTHRLDIVREHGIGRLLLWWIRISKSFIRYQVICTTEQLAAPQQRCPRLVLRVYRRALLYTEGCLRSFLRLHFDYDYF
jgi:glycosyltransferase involved in cell wall biosynthesis